MTFFVFSLSSLNLVSVALTSLPLQFLYDNDVNERTFVGSRAMLPSDCLIKLPLLLLLPPQHNLPTCMACPAALRHLGQLCCMARSLMLPWQLSSQMGALRELRVLPTV